MPRPASAAPSVRPGSPLSDRYQVGGYANPRQAQRPSRFLANGGDGIEARGHPRRIPGGDDRQDDGHSVHAEDVSRIDRQREVGDRVDPGWQRDQMVVIDEPRDTEAEDIAEDRAGETDQEADLEKDRQDGPLRGSERPEHADRGTLLEDQHGEG